jgi:hypothetical protein
MTDLECYNKFHQQFATTLFSKSPRCLILRHDRSRSILSSFQNQHLSFTRSVIPSLAQLGEESSKYETLKNHFLSFTITIFGLSSTFNITIPFTFFLLLTFPSTELSVKEISFASSSAFFPIFN